MSPRQKLEPEDPAADFDVETIDASGWLDEVIDGRYRILRYVDEGAMGMVFAGEHVSLGRAVAVKILRASLAEHSAILECFRREARAAANAGSPHIIDVYDFGLLEGGRAYVAMELLEGVSLEDLLDEAGPLPWPRGRDLALQICHGLIAAHRAGIIHRDLKPANLFLARGVQHPDGEILKILDFGLAELKNDEPTPSFVNGLVGTPAYMPPEQCLGGDVDARSDVYALGMILYEMFTGRLPFVGDLESVVLAQLRAAPPPIAEARPGHRFPDGLEALIARALEKEPDDRFQSVEDLEAALMQVGEAAVQTGPGRAPWGQLAVAGALAAFVGLGAAGAWAAGQSSSSAATPEGRVPASTPSVPPRAPGALPPSPTLRALTATTAPEEAPRAAPKRTESVVVQSRPPGAAVRHERVYIGLTPLRLQRPRDGSELDLSLGRRGFRTQRIRVSEDSPEVVSIELTERGAPRASRGRGRSAELVAPPEGVPPSTEQGAAAPAAPERAPSRGGLPSNPYADEPPPSAATGQD